jgi:hypothetical protein
MNKSLLEKIKSIGLSYRQYHDLTVKEIETTNPLHLTEEEKKLLENKKLNLHRMNRIKKQYCVADELKKLVQQIDKPQTWMIISETWCGDSAQNIPFIAKMAELNQMINLKIILRDSNPDIMDLYLTNGTRSIPILIAFNENGEELFRWGPRPQQARKLFADLKAQGFEKDYILEKLHLWYGRNKGKDIETEMLEMLKYILLPTELKENFTAN